MPAFKPWYRPIAVLGVILLAVIWIASGVLTREPPEPTEAPEWEPMRVLVEDRVAQPVEQLLILQGRIEPHLRVMVRVETAGQVERWAVVAGTVVDPGDELATLAMDDREARRRQAIARLRGRQSEFQATQRLVENQHVPEIDLEVAEAELEAARAELEAIELEIRHTRIRAPIPGVLEQRLAERGEFLSIGDAVGEVISNDPLLAVVQVPQHQIGRMSLGLPARIRLADGRRAEGIVRFVGTVAAPETRTFRVEIEIPNPERALPSGISARVEIPTDTVLAHRVSPAIISLDQAGRVGVKTVDAEDRVVFHSIEVVRTEPEGVWITGAPYEARLITVGQGFVMAGEQVRPELQNEGQNQVQDAPNRTTSGPAEPDLSPLHHAADDGPSGIDR
ncbi:MAG: efflux RND transporter periplasmic adaptor subunit [Thioalkalivibrio sp.]|nr:MAG: efflux RND transporter periplasmic adaptor subunit [Thioalkalivibrio sp.]